MNATAIFGTLTDYTTSLPIRPASAEEWRLTALTVNGDTAGSETGAFEDENGRAVWVEGGPEVEVSDQDIRDLEQEAGQAGDCDQVDLCRSALAGDEGARAECVRVIIDNRLNMVGE